MQFIVLIFLLILFTYSIQKFGVHKSLSTKDVLIGWGVKVGFSLLYLYIFLYYYGHGFLYGDSNRFLTDSEVIASIAYEYPIEYIKLLFGFADENSDILWPYIQKTQIWMYGDNGDFINDNRLILRLNSVIHLMSFGSIYIHLLVHVCLSFIGGKLIYQSFVDVVLNKKWFWYALIFLPSISFWGGAILKESILIFGLGLLFFSLKNLTEYKIKWIIGLVISCGILLFNKPYTGLIVVPISLLWLIGHKFNWNIKYVWTSSAVIIIVFIGLLFAPSKINLTQKVSYKQKDLMNMGKGGVFFITDSSFCAFPYNQHQNFKMVDDSLIQVINPSQGEYKLFGKYEFYPFKINVSDKLYAHYLTQIPSSSYYETIPIGNSTVQLIKNIPSAIWNVWVRPYPWDNGNGLKIFAFIQNVLLIGWLVFSFIKRKRLSLKDKWLLFILMVSALFVTLLIGWTTPIFGAAVRYKVPVDLFVLIISFILLKSKSHEKV